MSNFRSIRTRVVVALIAAAATGCGSGAGTSGAVPSAVAASRSADAATTLNVGGQFAGTVQDSVFGEGQIYADLTQYQDSVGGTMTTVYGSTVFIVPATFLLSGRRLTGNGAIGKVTGGVCTASETAMYTASRHLNGSYMATNGCSGDKGAFAMKQRCRYPKGSARETNFDLRRCN